MSSAQAVVKVVGRVTGRVRLWCIIDAFVRALKWVVVPSLLLYIMNLIWTITPVVMLLPGVALSVVFVVFAVGALGGINRFEVAKVIDDEMDLKDRMTSALYFEKLGTTTGLAGAAIDEASSFAGKIDTNALSVGTWPRHSVSVALLAVLTIIVGLGPLNIGGWFGGGSVEETEQIAEGPGKTIDPRATDGVGPEPTRLKQAKNKVPLEIMPRLEVDEEDERDPATMRTDMTEDIEDDIEAIKASINLADMKEIEEAFKDDEKRGPGEERTEKPPKIAPLDKELLDDIIRSKKEKMKRGEGSPDDAIGIAVKMPAKPGARQKGARRKGRGGHGGGDVGASGDTRGAPRRKNIPGRDSLIVESRRSKDLIEKTDLERVVMNELMMRLSMENIEMKGKPVNIPARFRVQSREPVVEEMIPLGLRGYVQRYFKGLGGS